MTDERPSAPPRWAAAAWSSDRGAPPGGDKGLSTRRIVQAALELADEEGLAALSIRKLGQRLGAGTMAAYRHIDSRDDLIVLMIDEALGAPASSIVDGATWQEGVTRWAAGMSRSYRRHPWLVDAPIPGIPATPNRALWLEYILQVLAPTGLKLNLMLDAALLVDGHVRNTAYLQRELGRSVGDDRSVEWLAPLLASRGYPMLVTVLESGELQDDTEQSVDFGLARIIAGIDVLLAE